MISNVMVRVSFFADYSSLVFNNESVINIMNSFNSLNLAPNQVAEVDANGFVSQRMMFTGMNNFLSILINGQRIDITRVSNEKAGFSSDQIDEIKSLCIEIYEKLYEIFKERAPIPNRLAWFTNYVYFEIDNEEKSRFRNKFLKELSFFEENRLDDMLARYATRKHNNICDHDELVNVLATLSRYESNGGMDLMVDGYNMELDINTWQNNKINRFRSEDIKEFMKIAYDYQIKIKGEVFGEP